MGHLLPVIVCIDAEPDEREPSPGRPRPWGGYLALQARLAALRDRLPGPGSTAHFAWFVRMDPQIADTYGTPAWGAVTYGAELDGALRRGDEIGLHVHPYRKREGLPGWISDFGDQAWVNDCLHTGLTAFEAARGRRCGAFRFGDGWMNDATVAWLGASGVCYDLTLEPGKNAPHGIRRGAARAGLGPDLTSVPGEPYRPAADDFRRPDSTRTDGLWMIPVTTGRVRPSLERLRALYRAIRRPGWITSPRIVLNPALSPLLFRDLLDRTLESSATRLLVLAVRSDSGLSRRRLGNVCRNLVTLCRRRPRGGEPVFCTPAEALAALELEPGSSSPQTTPAETG